MSRVLGMILLLSAVGSGAALADALYQLTELEGVYPPDRQQIITFPEDMSTATTLLATLTHTASPGQILCDGDTEPSEFMPGVIVEFYAEWQGTTYRYWTGFAASWNPGSPVTQTMELHSPPFYDILQGQTVTVTCYRNTWDYCEILDPGALEVDSLQLQIVGNIVATELTSLTTIKQLFD